MDLSRRPLHVTESICVIQEFSGPKAHMLCAIKVLLKNCQ